MSLIHQLRQQDIINEAKPETTPYEPHFMIVVRRKGLVHVSQNTIDIEDMECEKKAGCSLEKWLLKNNLKKDNSDIPEHYKIFI